MTSILDKSFSEIKIDIEDLESTTKGDSEKLISLIGSLTGGSKNPLETIKRICDLSREFVLEDQSYKDGDITECLGRTKAMLQFSNFAALMVNLSSYAEESVAGFGFEALLAGMHGGERIASGEGSITDIVVDGEKYSLKLLTKDSDSKMEGDLGRIALDTDMYHAFLRGKFLEIRKHDGKEILSYKLDVGSLLTKEQALKEEVSFVNKRHGSTNIKKSFIENILKTITQDISKHMTDEHRKEFEQEIDKLKGILVKTNFGDEEVEIFLDYLVSTSSHISDDAGKKVEKQVDKLKDFLGAQLSKKGVEEERPVHISNKEVSKKLTVPFFDNLDRVSDEWLKEGKNSRYVDEFFTDVMKPRLDQLKASKNISPSMIESLWHVPPELVSLAEDMRREVKSNPRLRLDLQRDLGNSKEIMGELFSGIKKTSEYEEANTAEGVYNSLMSAGNIVDLTLAPPFGEVKKLFKIIDEEVRSGLAGDGLKDSNIIRKWLFSDDVRTLFSVERNEDEKQKLLKGFQNKKIEEAKGQSTFARLNGSKRFFESYLKSLVVYASERFGKRNVNEFLKKLGKKAKEYGYISSSFKTPKETKTRLLFVNTGMLLTKADKDGDVVYYSSGSPTNRSVGLDDYIKQKMDVSRQNLGTRAGEANRIAVETESTDRLIYIIALKDMNGDQIFKMDFYYIVLTAENLDTFLQVEGGKDRLIPMETEEFVSQIKLKDKNNYRLDSLSALINSLEQKGIDVSGLKTVFEGNSELDRPVLYTGIKDSSDMALKVSLKTVQSPEAYLGSMLLDREYLSDILQRYLGGTENNKGVLEQLEEINLLFDKLKNDFYKFAGSFSPEQAIRTAKSSDDFTKYMKKVTINCNTGDK